jgi:hypothetical protein
LKKTKTRNINLLLIAAIITTVIIGCSGGGSTPLELDKVLPLVDSVSPTNAAVDVPINGTISVTFSEDMDDSTIIAANFTVNDGSSVAGTVSYDQLNYTAVFTPTDLLDTSTNYTVTVTTAVKDLAGNALAEAKVWSFTTAGPGAGPDPVNLGTAGNFAILAKSAISTVPASVITGDVGISPAAETFMTGFSQTDATGYATSPQVTGSLYAADMAPPTPTKMTTAISDMELAYTNAAGRSGPVDLGTAEIGGRTDLTPGLYKYTGTVLISSDLVLTGAANDVWIFQMTNDLSIAANKSITLAGGALPGNIFWQVTGEVVMEAGADFKGIVLSKTAITMQTGATMNGRLLAQTNVALDQSTVTKPSF